MLELFFIFLYCYVLCAQYLCAEILFFHSRDKLIYFSFFKILQAGHLRLAC